ncbi:hypothetical protein HLB23_33975 [Nocardia uniformis]|uniref:Uncharacterized protein n=1 Tax=Nocardia uniformis TaxID=53432 RepID=A0A849C877_9NOCA|nr:hypothetical protein [Nocardia uniformis]NNH74802.1 hypothetical protein [Nocardia uniformis]
MSLLAKRITIALAAAALTSGMGVATAGVAAADNGRGYEYYCDKNSHGYDWNYCWKHYSDRWNRDHKNNNRNHDNNRSGKHGSNSHGGSKHGGGKHGGNHGSGNHGNRGW